MSESGAPPVKRMRYNLRSSVRSQANVTNETTEPNARKRAKKTTVTVAANRPVATASNNSAYRLRSNGKIDGNDVQFIDALPRKRKKKNLLALNPDCLLKLFEYMNVVDLCNMAETCTSLFNYAKYHFRLKYKHFDFVSMFDGELLSVDMASRLFRIFGDQIHTLKISRVLFQNGEDVSSELLLSAAENCGHIVKALTLEQFYMDPGIMMDCSTLFNSLETLTLEDCSMYDVPWCDMNNLKVLKLSDIEGLYFDEATFDKLEVVEFDYVDIDPASLMEFIRSVPTIKRLSITKCISIPTSIFSAIKNLVNLEYFEFFSNRPNRSDDLHRRDTMNLVSLKKLKRLNISCNDKSVHQLIDGFHENKIALEHLELDHGLLNAETVAAIAKLKTIKVLKFNEMINFAEYSMLQIARELNQLEELHIKTSAIISQFRIRETIRQANRLTCLKICAKDIGLNIDSYRAALIAVQKRSNQNHLAITIYGDDQPRILVPEPELKGPNEKWLKVNQLNRNTKNLFPPAIEWDNFEDFDGDFDEDDDEFDEAELFGLE